MYEARWILYEPSDGWIFVQYPAVPYISLWRLIAVARNISYFCADVDKVIVISRGTELLRVPACRLVYISPDGNYSNVVTQDNRKQIVSFQLGQIEDLIRDQLDVDENNFIRLGRGLIINLDFVYSIDISKQKIILSDCLNCYHELSASKEVLTKLKSYLNPASNND